MTQTDTKDHIEVEPCVIRFDDDRKRRVPKWWCGSGNHEYIFCSPFERGCKPRRTANIGGRNEGKDEC